MVAMDASRIEGRALRMKIGCKGACVMVEDGMEEEVVGTCDEEAILDV